MKDAAPDGRPMDGRREAFRQRKQTVDTREQGTVQTFIDDPAPRATPVGWKLRGTSSRPRAGHRPPSLIAKTAALLLAVLMLPALGSDRLVHGQATRIFSTQGLEGTFAYLSYARAPEHYPEHLLKLSEMTWDDADQLCRFLGWRLPTQAEIEAFVGDRAYPDRDWLSEKHFYTVHRNALWLTDRFAYFIGFDNGVWKLDNVTEYRSGKLWAVCVRGAYRGAAAANLPRVTHDKPSAAPAIVLTRQPDRAEEVKAAAEASARAAREYEQKRAAEEQQRVAKENAQRQAMVLEREVLERRSCMKPENRGGCGCLKYQATPPGGWGTCGK
jgi:hypothetical protein